MGPGVFAYFPVSVPEVRPPGQRGRDDAIPARVRVVDVFKAASFVKTLNLSDIVYWQSLENSEFPRKLRVSVKTPSFRENFKFQQATQARADGDGMPCMFREVEYF